HDVGKIGVPESVLCKPGKLTNEEYAQIKKHPEIGYQIVKDIPLLDDTLPGILHHHERYDGRGYPAGLVGEHIPFMARIIGLADAFDAMSSTRTYRAAMDREKVLSEIQNGAGTQFDPELVAVFSTIDLAVFDQMVERHQQQSAKGGIRLRLSSGEAA
ncbi:MAG: HD domain-containing protein, partial [Phycisphaerales bacterium]|nr:HD domain-containing protein [Phycisphaerales bacterium]